MAHRAAPELETTLHDQACLAVRAVYAALPGSTFSLRRLAAAVGASDGPVGRALRPVVRALQDHDPVDPSSTELLAGALVRSGGTLERIDEHVAARALFELASELRPTCARTALHAGRAARRAGHPEAALAHYTRAITLDGGGKVARLARIGEAMVSRASEERLSREIRRALRSGDGEAAGVGLEARAAFRCETARCRDAIRDLCACALRYPDREDQARAAERVATLLAESHDLEAAREALLLVDRIGTDEQRAAARRRLHALSADAGDMLGVRRWRDAHAPGPRREHAAGAAPAPAALPASGDDTRPTAPSRAPRRREALPMIRGWRSAVERRAGAS
jgi:hypothetical protein